MIYVVTVGSKTFEVRVDGTEVSIDGRPAEAVLVSIPATPLRQLVVAGRSRTFALARDPEGWLLQWGGERLVARVEDERSRRLQAITAAARRDRGSAIVRAPMPGLVLRLEVEEGQRVEAGSGLLVLEAMKMENEITAPSTGIVRAVRVAAGEVVEKGVALVEIAALEG